MSTAHDQYYDEDRRRPRQFRFIRENFGSGPGLHGHIDTKQDNCYCYPNDTTAMVWVQPSDFTNYMARVRPSIEDLMEWSDDGGCEATDGCWVEPDGTCEHGKQSWMLEMGLI